MEELEIKQLWQQYDKRLEESLRINKQIIREMQTQKAESKINSFQIRQVVGLILGIFWVIFLGFLVVNTLNNLYFAISVGLIMLFNIFAIAVYIRNLELLSQINITDNITDSQQKLATIQSSLINVGRILILQTPFYCTFYYSNELVAHAGTLFWLIQLVALSFFTGLSIYLYRTLTYKNIHRKWVRNIIGSFGGKTLTKAMEFLNEIEDYRTERTS